MVCWEKFGKIWGSVEVAILEGVVLGCCCVFRVTESVFRDGSGRGRKGRNAGILGGFGG